MDGDGDGFATAVQGGDDCDDADPATHPGAAEVCGDGVDQDCRFGDWPADEDGAGHLALLCGGEDCHDFMANMNPDALEECDNLDNDCDGVVDDGLDPDGDGYCLGDCDEADPEVFPGSWFEVDGDGIDTSCDGEDGLSPTFAPIWLVGPAPVVLTSMIDDIDGDGLPDLAVSTEDDGYPNGGHGSVFVVRAAALPPWGEYDLAGAHATVRHDAPGYRLAGGRGGPDADGDDLGDLLIRLRTGGGGPTGTFSAFVIGGATLVAGGETDLSEPLIQVHGVMAYSSFGYAMEWLGDLDGDGLADFAAGARAAGQSEATTGQGFVSVVLGSTTASESSATSLGSDHVLWGPGRGDRCGHALAGGGDVDGDGLADFVVGCNQDIGWDSDGGRGKAYVVLGSELMDGTTTELAGASSLLVGVTDQDFAGADVAMISDVDGDGRSEVAMGAMEYYQDNPPIGPGSAYVWLSSSLDGGGEAAATTADLVIRGAANRSQFGGALASGDVDGDGLGDLLVGSSWPGHSGAHLFLGAGMSGGGEVDVTGAAISWIDSGPDLIGDFDGDGLDDVTVSLGAGLIPSQFARLQRAR